MEKNPKIVVIHGPNLNLLGTREPEIYGSMTLREIDRQIEQFADQEGIAFECFQSNHEGAIIDKIHEAGRIADGIVINPGAFTHYSYAIYDALLSVGLPAIEIHISDITKREEFRKISVIAPACRDRIIGQGWQGYLTACRKLLDILQD